VSVINKMLRDLDRRANPSAAAQPGPAALRQGTASVTIDTLASPQGTASSNTRMWLGLGLLVVAATSVGGWMWWESTTTAPTVPGAVSVVAPVVIAPPTVAASAATSVASEVASTAAAAPLPAASASTDGGTEPSLASVFLRMEPSLSARKALDALLSTPVPVAASTPTNVPTIAPPITAPTASTTVTTPTPAATAAAPVERPAPRPQGAKATPPTSPSPSATPDSAPVLQRQQQAGSDALAQAQALWNSGSRDAAMDLMQQSIAAAERSAKAGGPSASSTAVLLPLVREMARMQLAEARFGAVWEMLTRLEPLLGNPPDLWAIRANAAQRLGRHQDSVHAYMMALQSRPDEQRWLLGTAVSLAALGQTSSAAEMAEKARAQGPVGKDILAYLRQAGVPLRDQ
jgi:MSHA biogenesis protein MshN